MMSGHQDNQAEQLDREAHRLITQLVSGDASLGDAQAIKLWRQQSPAHDAAFVAAVRQWRDFGPAGHQLRARADLPVWTPPLVSRRAFLGGTGAVAAVGVAGYAVVRPPLGLWPSLSELTADYRTATGEQRGIELGEHVTVRLNSQTSIAVPRSVNDRDQVRLIAGEAAFATTTHRILEVMAGNGRTLATEARFDVRSVGSSVCVTCFEGDVRVESGAQIATVGSNRQIRYGAAGLQAAVIVDPLEAAAWHDGFLAFHLTPLSEVIAEINRYRPGRVILTNASLGKKPVNGRFSIRRLDEALRWIEYAFDAKPRALPGGILLLS